MSKRRSKADRAQEVRPDAATPSPARDDKRWHAALAVTLVLSAFLLLYNLGDRPLWGDEAETALLALNTLEYGIPKADDGKNYITLLGPGRDTNESGIWVWSPWLDEYVAAAAFAVLGKSTTVARLPFALIGVLSVAALAFITHRLFARRDVTLVAMLLFAMNVPFVLHTRQCRYYSIVILAQLAIIGALYLMLNGKTRSGGAWLAGGLIVQFYCNYMLVAGNVLAILAFAAVYYRRDPRIAWSAGAAIACVCVAALPWLLYAKPAGQSGYMSPAKIFPKLGFYLSQLHFHVVPLVIVVALVLVVLAQRRKAHARLWGDQEILLWLLVAVHLGVLTIAPGPYFRYILPVAPVLLILTAFYLCEAAKQPAVQAVAVLTLVSTNALAVITAYPVDHSKSFDIPVLRVMAEICLPYDSALEHVSAYMKKHGKPSDSVYVLDPELPLIFYTDMKIVDGRLNPKPDLTDPPNWVLSESVSGLLEKPELRLPPFLQERYETIVLDVPDTPRGDSCPDPDYHVSFTSESTRKFTMYRRVK